MFAGLMIGTTASGTGGNKGTEFEDFCASSLFSLFPPVQKNDLRILNIISSGL
jgi:hypothetical protein